MKEYRVIIAGSRGCPEYDALLLNKIDRLLIPKMIPSNTEIVSGTAKGGDRLGENFADINGYDLKKFPAKWDLLGKSAGYIRNSEMAKYSTHLVAFWDEVSKGTQHMIDIAIAFGLEIRIINYNDGTPIKYQQTWT